MTDNYLKTIMLKTDRNLNNKEFEDLLKTVSPNRLKEITAFRSFEDAQRSLLGEVLVKKVIKNNLGLPIHQIKLNANEHGKPFLVNAANFHFNLSHSGKYVACAFSNAPVGIDIEVYKQVNTKIAERYFCAGEKEYILSYPAQEQTKAFYQIWTKKEAFVKYKGKGLSVSLNSFNVLEPCGVFFHCIHEDTQTICHVCSENIEKPLPIFLTTDNLLEDM